MDLPRLHGIVPPVPSPLLPDESIDVEALARLVEFQLKAGVHGLWILGTTARFDLLTDARLRDAAEVAASAAAGRVPLVLNVSEQGPGGPRRGRPGFDDLPMTTTPCCRLVPVMTSAEVTDYFLSLATAWPGRGDLTTRPGSANQLSFPHFGSSPSIRGSWLQDVTPSLSRALDWPRTSAEPWVSATLHGSDQISVSTDLGADGFVSALFELLPSWSWRCGTPFARRMPNGPSGSSRNSCGSPARRIRTMHACLEVIARHGDCSPDAPRASAPARRETARRIVASSKPSGSSRTWSRRRSEKGRRSPRPTLPADGESGRRQAGRVLLRVPASRLPTGSPRRNEVD